jgi:hypothetical protein
MYRLLKLQLNLLLGVATSAYVDTRKVHHCLPLPMQSARNQMINTDCAEYALCSYLNFAKNHLFPRSWQESSSHFLDLQHITVKQYQLSQTRYCIITPAGHTSKHISHTVTKELQVEC